MRSARQGLVNARSASLHSSVDARFNRCGSSFWAVRRGSVGMLREPPCGKGMRSPAWPGDLRVRHPQACASCRPIETDPMLMTRWLTQCGTPSSMCRGSRDRCEPRPMYFPARALPMSSSPRSAPIATRTLRARTRLRRCCLRWEAMSWRACRPTAKRKSRASSASSNHLAPRGRSSFASA